VLFIVLLRAFAYHNVLPLCTTLLPTFAEREASTLFIDCRHNIDVTHIAASYTATDCVRHKLGHTEYVIQTYNLIIFSCSLFTQNWWKI